MDGVLSPTDSLSDQDQDPNITPTATYPDRRSRSLKPSLEYDDWQSILADVTLLSDFSNETLDRLPTSYILLVTAVLVFVQAQDWKESPVYLTCMKLFAAMSKHDITDSIPKTSFSLQLPQMSNEYSLHSVLERLIHNSCHRYNDRAETALSCPALYTIPALSQILNSKPINNKLAVVAVSSENRQGPDVGTVVDQDLAISELLWWNANKHTLDRSSAFNNNSSSRGSRGINTAIQPTLHTPRVPIPCLPNLLFNPSLSLSLGGRQRQVLLAKEKKHANGV